ncbi:MAG: VOC family protein [Oscillospiraceae bacterium]|nr:VOC family protein [Oscillospiraceae bacterium]
MKMQHVTIQTSHFEEEVRFYEEIVGLTIQRDMRPAGRNMVFLADVPGDTCVELIEAPEADDTGSAWLSIGFKAPDVVKKREELLALGMDVTPMREPGPGTKFFFVKDPAGVNVQFI